MFFLFCLFASLPTELNSLGQSVIEISANKSIDEIKHDLKSYDLDASSATIEINLDEKENKNYLCINHKMKAHGQYLGFPRPYNVSLTDNEKQDVKFILTFLANASLFSLALHKNELQAAGDRIDHLHPLRFFGFVFSDEELKVCFRNIRANGWIWKDFAGGIKQSLSSESQNGNMKDEFIADFASNVKLDAKWIRPAIQRKNWDEFIDTLIAKVPRAGDHDRYQD